MEALLVKVTKAEIIRGKEPLSLPEPWLAAWREPNGTPVRELEYALYKIHTGEGIVGYGPYTGAAAELALGEDPAHVGAFWESNMSGRRAGTSGKNAAGIEIAFWDILAKAADMPIYKMLGARRNRLLVYAATSRLLLDDRLADLAREIADTGFKALKLRLHRPDPKDDLAAIEAVRRALGDDYTILVDANQNNASPGYNFWSRRRAALMARELEELGVYFLEEPLPRTDVEGLAEIAASVDMFIAGGEHTPTVYDFREHVTGGAYDIIQPDVALGGNFGITGLREAATLANFFGRLIVPHVLSNGHFSICLAATLHAMATVDNCPLVEFAYDPPILTTETTQAYTQEPLFINDDGCIELPGRPGLGITVKEEMFT